MYGLPETFDMAKRVSLILYFPIKTNRERSFDEVFFEYQNNFNWLNNDIKKYRIGCNNPWSQHKCQLGQPQLSSKTSFSKYMRVAHGMNFIAMEKKQNSWNLKPTSLTNIVNILYKINQSNNTPFFEISAELKLLFTKNLLKNDGIFIIPILKSLKESEVSSNTGFLNKIFLEVCANNLLNCFSDSIYSELIKPEEARILIKRINFFKDNQTRIKNFENPTRGFLHIIEPRIHWLIDLLLIDYSIFCTKGKIQPASFFLDFLDQPKREYEPLMKKYFEYLLDLNFSNLPFKGENQKTIDDSINISIKELQKYYPRLIPIASAISLIQIIGSNNTRKYVASDDILIKLKQKYSILRDWGSEEGFLDVGFGNTGNDSN